ncbi:YhjD/YihY/BrkB family envelope integrity protein [Streptomyces sp. NPDC051940]|uniref:YhjD/YihY/BrkB family envelope integrity protein n=1 Tax=Streptomyces sp. NPDC051940 TaxID=3155675 RepID=UPI00342CF3DC
MDRDEREGDFLLGKVKDAGVLLSLGGTLIVTVGISVTAATAVTDIVDAAGLGRSRAGVVLIAAPGFGASFVAGVLLMFYALTPLPDVWPERRSTLVAALMGALGFEVLKLMLSGYLSAVASRSVYGAFGVPVALLLWIHLMARLSCTARPGRPSRTTAVPSRPDHSKSLMPELALLDRRLGGEEGLRPFSELLLPGVAGSGGRA